jgi:hypothetical protein
VRGSTNVDWELKVTLGPCPSGVVPGLGVCASWS